MKSNNEKRLLELEEESLNLEIRLKNNKEKCKKSNKKIADRQHLIECERAALMGNNETTIPSRKQILLMVQYACDEYKVLKDKIPALSYSFLCRILLIYYRFIRKLNEHRLSYGQLLNYIKKCFAGEISTVPGEPNFAHRKRTKFGELMKIA